jgi:hypothetical protein
VDQVVYVYVILNVMEESVGLMVVEENANQDVQMGRSVMRTLDYVRQFAHLPVMVVNVVLMDVGDFVHPGVVMGYAMNKGDAYQKAG